MKYSRGRLWLGMLKRLLVPIALLVLVLFVLTKINLLPSFSDWFKRKPLVIANTPLVITQVKNIAQLQAVQLYAEIVVDSTVFTRADIAKNALKSLGIPILPFPETKSLVLIVSGKVIAGIDLKKLTPGNFFVEEDSVSIRLPPAEILDVVTNPSDFETFAEKGKWSDEEIRLVKLSARRQLEQEAADQHLLKKANERSRMVIQEFLRLAGFTKINLY